MSYLTFRETQEIRAAIAVRLQECGLELHPEKTKVFYCKDDDRRRTYPHEKFDFLGYTFRPRRSKNRKGKYFINFSPAVSDRAAIRTEIRSSNLHLRSDKSIEDLSRMFNPIIRGWLQYYGRFYRSALYPPMRQLDRSLARWADQKYKKPRRHLRRATHEDADATDAAALRRLDRKRPKTMRNEEWQNPADGEAEITRLKDGRTALAYKAEQAVDMETGAILAVTTHGGAVGDTDSIGGTVAEAGIAVAEQAVERAVNQTEIEEVVADKGYHSNEVMRTLAEWKLRSYVAEPERGAQKWKGKAAEQAAVYANRRRISAARGKCLQAGRGERVERNFAHQFDTGGLDRLCVRGLGNVHKKLLIQATACNLALLMRSLYGAGKPRAAHDRWGQLTFTISRLY